MVTRAIVTSQPDIACYVCGRRLLRGEQPEVFLVDGRAQNVCELCAPRAALQGWARGGSEGAETEPEREQGARPGLLSRLRRGSQGPTTARRGARARVGSAAAPTPEPADETATAAARVSAFGDRALHALGPAPEPASPGAIEHAGLEHALQAFNGGEYPRRIAGLARSLGVPEVSALYDRDLNLVTIVVAWELCWYRYRVDLDALELEARMTAEGRTLEQLPRDERVANATVDDAGVLSLAVAAV
jgi:hypothetical protein